jgi:hypothetical protein
MRTVDTFSQPPPVVHTDTSNPSNLAAFGHTTTLNAAACCVPASTISAGQHLTRQAPLFTAAISYSS